MPEIPAGPCLENAEIEWFDGVPRSRRFRDIYFSPDNGLEEARHVFLEQNSLPQRFRALSPGSHFVVAESGFGTGLNFLATWQLWQTSEAARHSVLHYVSVERYPLSSQDLLKALAAWPELATLTDELIDHYPPPVPGVHRLLLMDGRVRLTLFLGDILEGWREMQFQADAWFLDGFAPACNPEMWQDEAFSEMHRHSKPGTTLATFTAAGRVRRGLEQQGFTVTKVAGYGRKPEMLAGHLPGESPATAISPRDTVTIVGAGISGCLLARNLAERGVRVSLLDSGEGPASGASGNRQGALYVKLGVDYNHQTRLALSALLFSQHYYRQFADDCWHETGLLQLAYDEQEASRQRRFLARHNYPQAIFSPVSAAQAADLAGIPIPHDGLWFPRSGWLEPARFCKALVRHPLIHTVFELKVQQVHSDSRGWQLLAEDGRTFTSDSIVLCSGHLTPGILPEGHRYRFKPIRGQVTHLPPGEHQPPDLVVCGSRYLNPANDGISVTGATFDLHSHQQALTPESHRENLTQLTSMLPGIQLKTDPQKLDGRVAFRCTTHDYQPVVGPVRETSPPGLYLLTGLGSKGLAYAPLLAEYLADCLTDQPRALPDSLAGRLGSERCRYPE